jgi:hypothetical protein
MRDPEVSISFNSAITGIPLETGKFNDTAHTDQILPLRGLIMQLDGVTGMNIGRYGMKVYYLDEMTEPAKILKIVQRSINELMEREGNRLFPIRGDKTPTATIDEPEPSVPDYKQSVIARFDTDLTAYSADSEQWAETSAHVKSVLSSVDGVRGCGVYLREVAVCFDSRTITATDMKHHIGRVLRHLDTFEGRPFFPFLNGRQLSFSFETREGKTV